MFGCFWHQKVSSQKKVRTVYEDAITSFFQLEQDKKSFIPQMQHLPYRQINFMNIAADKYPCRFLAGTDYFMFFRDLNCCFIRTADIKNIYVEEEKSKVHYHVNDYHTIENITYRIYLVMEYKDNSISKRDKILDRFYLENGKQAIKVLQLIKKYCPASAKFIK